MHTDDVSQEGGPAPAAPRPGRLLGLQAWQVLAGCAAVLAAARVLHPDARGYGTHQQLLLPPCGFHLITHLPCPSCGMTTGFALMARGQVLSAARANLMAPPAFALTIALGLAALWGAVTGREWLPAWVFHRRLPRLALAFVLCCWAANIIRQLVVP